MKKIVTMMLAGLVTIALLGGCSGSMKQDDMMKKDEMMQKDGMMKK